MLHIELYFFTFTYLNDDYKSNTKKQKEEINLSSPVTKAVSTIGDSVEI